MAKEKSCGAVVYKIENGIIYFLIEKMKKGHFSMPKGHVENGETEIQTALREIKEETNLDVTIDDSFKETITYEVENKNLKDVVFFIASYDKGTIVNQEKEVSDIYFLPFDKAYNKLTYKSDKNVLLKAYLYLIKKYSKKIIIIGCPGSGKSYLSRYLTKYTNIQLHHLDNMYWFGNYNHIKEEEFVNKVNEVMKNPSWIIDGHFKESLALRVNNADTVIYFNLNGITCVNGVKHRIKYHSVRDDMPCVETTLDKEFEECMLHFRKNNNPKIQKLFKEHPCNVLTIKTKKQLKEVIKFIEK